VTPSITSRGAKGQYYTSHTRKRVRKSRDAQFDFNALFKDDAQAHNYSSEFEAAIERKDTGQQDALIGALIVMGASARLLETVLHVDGKDINV
jgi:DNA integrity scanning protein DisA with diadenylate cyclase activity